MVKSDILPFNFTAFKNIEQDQFLLKTFKKEFEVSDGLGKLYITYSKIFEFLQFQIIIEKKCIPRPKNIIKK